MRSPLFRYKSSKTGQNKCQYTSSVSFNLVGTVFAFFAVLKLKRHQHNQYSLLLYRQRDRHSALILACCSMPSEIRSFIHHIITIVTSFYIKYCLDEIIIYHILMMSLRYCKSETKTWRIGCIRIASLGKKNTTWQSSIASIVFWRRRICVELAITIIVIVCQLVRRYTVSKRIIQYFTSVNHNIFNRPNKYKGNII